MCPFETHFLDAVEHIVDMKKWSCRMCKQAQHGVKYGAWPSDTELYQTGKLNLAGRRGSSSSRSFAAPTPCLTLSYVIFGSPVGSLSSHEPDYQRRCFATKARSRTYYYDLLGVSPKATQGEIKSAYYKLSKVYHPDINKQGESKMFTQITEAYEILGNKRKRRMYDHGIYSRNEPSADEHDYSQSFRQREGFGSERQAPPTGRTSQYNFDEFYRQHYGNTIKQEKADREYNRQMQYEMALYEVERKVRIFVTVGVVISLIAMFLISSESRPQNFQKTAKAKNSNPVKD